MRSLIRPLPPRHHIVTANVGGQVGKSTLILNLAAYLTAEEPNASTVMIVDAAAPQLSLFDSFKHIFGLSDEGKRFYDGEDYIRAPRLDVASTRNLIVVKVNPDYITTWGSLVRKIKSLDYACTRDGHFLTHILTETNLQPTADNAEQVFSELDYQALAYWTVWNHESLAARDTYDQLVSFERDFSPKPIRFFYVHNPYLDAAGWNGGRMSAMLNCFNATPEPMPDPTSKFLDICDRAEKAQARGLSGNDFWQQIYQDFVGQSQGARRHRPRNLLPVYQKSTQFNTIMSNKWANLRDPVRDITTLATVLDRESAGLYSGVFKPFFQQMGGV